MRTSEPTVLDITRMHNGYEVRLRRPGDPLQPLVQYVELRVNHSTISDFCDQLALKIRQENSGRPAPFGGMCEALMNVVFSEAADPRIKELRDVIRKLESPLLIVTNEPQVPWELLKDGRWDDDYVGLRIDVGRSLKVKMVPQSVPRSNTNFNCLLIADPNADEPKWALDHAAEEAHTLCEWLTQRQVDCSDPLFGVDATVGKLFEKLAANRYDIIHYAGHVVLDPASNEYALRLNGGGLFPASSIRSLVKGTPLVFLNACRSSSMDRAAVNGAGSIEGLTNAFIEAGAQLVIGALFEVPEGGAREFAVKFYEAVLDRQPVGAAMRQARLHVRGRPGCGAAWASFVLYGDPCLKVEVRVDGLGSALKGMGLAREDFDPGCLRAVERAFEFGKGNGGVATAHLFAALMSGEQDHLRNRLDQLGVPSKDLADAFKQFFKFVGSESAESDQPEVSANVEAILKASRELSRNAGRKEIEELDIVEAFAKQGGGGVGEILTRLGVDVASLSPGAPNVRSASRLPLIDTVGHLTRERCTDAAWQVLADASHLTRGHTGQRISTTHVLLAMLRDASGHLGSVLLRFGIDPLALQQSLRKLLGIDPKEEWPAMGVNAYPVQCSPNCAETLALALAQAKVHEDRNVDVGDLLHGLLHVRDENASVAVLLRGLLGMDPSLLMSDLFDSTGSIRADKADEGLRRVIDGALRCIRDKGLRRVHRVHLLYGMLACSDGQFAGLVRGMGVDPGALAELLYVGLPAQQPRGDAPVTASARHLSAGVLRALRAAEVRAHAAGTGQIGEADLLFEFLVDPGTTVGEFLVARGVSLQGLRESLRHAPPRHYH